MSRRGVDVVFPHPGPQTGFPQIAGWMKLGVVQGVFQLPIWLGVFLLSVQYSAFAQSPNASVADVLQEKESGPVKLSVRMTPAEPTIGDELRLVIRAEAEADVELLMPEFGEALSRYTIIEFVPSKNIAANGTTVETQTYTLQPFVSGPQSIPPILVEFVDNRPGKQSAPDDFDAYEILTDRIQFNVKSVLDDSDNSLRPPMGELQLIESKSQSPIYWIVGFGIALLLAVLALIFIWRNSKRGARRRSAYEVAAARLADLKADRRSSNPTLSVDAFYVEVSSVIRQYLEDRFEIRAPEQTTDEFLQLAAEQSALSREHQRLLADFLQQCDIVKFAGKTATDDDMARSLVLGDQFLEETRDVEPDTMIASGPIAQPAIPGHHDLDRGAVPQPDASEAWNTRSPKGVSSSEEPPHA